MNIKLLKEFKTRDMDGYMSTYSIDTFSQEQLDRLYKELEYMVIEEKWSIDDDAIDRYNSLLKQQQQLNNAIKELKELESNISMSIIEMLVECPELRLYEED